MMMCLSSFVFRYPLFDVASLLANRQVFEDGFPNKSGLKNNMLVMRRHLALRYCKAIIPYN